VSGPKDEMERAAERIRLFYERADLRGLEDLLDPHVHWGAPGAKNPTCKNKEQVLAWITKSLESGRRGQVNDITVLDDKVLVELVTHRTQAAEVRGGAALRWQVLTVRDGLIVDIVGFDDRDEALAHAHAHTGGTSPQSQTG
jgi:ketosteroid isomerase-like protein